MNLKIIFSILSSVCALSAHIPYLWSTFFGRVRPHAFTWLIWTITTAVATAGAWKGGGGVGAISPTISVF
ncbi:TPA: hypothetical protein DEA21_00790 [Candidatus Uhrbacteria bacterium]|nr:hypothetical protein [Candidatus Uhrbacteria bacterium]HCU31974.1 hypothetical protein [Candidatus Uhrbacteria bacterium]